MSNTILIKHGSGKPEDVVLEPYELGYNTTDKKLYIGITEEIEGNKAEAVSVGYAETANSANSAATASKVNNQLTITLGSGGNTIEYNGSEARAIEITPDSIGTAYQSKSSIVDSIYPIGSIYMNINKVSPETLFGGTWEPLENRFLLGASKTYTTAGGNPTHTLTIEEMPSHTHTFTGSSATTSEKGSHQHEIPDTRGSGVDSSTTVRLESWEAVGTSDRKPMTTSAGEHTHTVTAKGTNSNTGGGKAFSIMPPYLPVYMWQRTA